jgi:hypoxanthine phosphoribosyltransferase
MSIAYDYSAAEVGRNDLPDWFDDRLAESLHRKRNRPRGALSFIDVAAFKTLSFCFGSKTWRYDQPHDWSELERYIEHDCDEIRAADFRPDAIIGIRSGGAFIANYVGRCLGVRDVGYVRVDRYSPVLGSAFLAVICKYFAAPRLTADADLDLTGRKVLLVDDQVRTGKSLSTARQWVEERGAVEIRTYCMFTQGYRPDFGRRAGIMMNCPWGDDP